MSALLSFARPPVAGDAPAEPRPLGRSRPPVGGSWRRRAAPQPGMRIETARLVLRLYRPQDFEPLHAMSAHPAMWTYSERGPMSPEESWARLLRHAGHWALHGYGIFAIEEKGTGALVGEVGFADFCRGLGDDFDPFPEACWAIRPEWQGRGYAGEAAQSALFWLARNRNAAETVCLIHVGNAASLGLAGKLGYVPFRTLIYRGYRALLLRRDGEGDEPDR